MAARFDISSTRLAGVYAITRRQHTDERGFLDRMFCVDELAEAGFDAPPAQINHTLTRRRGALRGLHYQTAPHAEIKLVSCIAGRMFDVAVDLRRSSPTFLMWHAEELTADNHRSLLIPEGCAHGFQTLTDDCELLYVHSKKYAPAAEGGVNHADPRIGIAWPVPVVELSERDRALPFVSESFAGL